MAPGALRRVCAGCSAVMRLSLQQFTVALFWCVVASDAELAHRSSFVRALRFILFAMFFCARVKKRGLHVRLLQQRRVQEELCTTIAPNRSDSVSARDVPFSLNFFPCPSGRSREFHRARMRRM